jgi:hypothetical protein
MAKTGVKEMTQVPRPCVQEIKDKCGIEAEHEESVSPTNETITARMEYIVLYSGSYL